VRVTATEDARGHAAGTSLPPDRHLVLGQVCDDMMDGIVVLDADMTYVLVNPAAARLLGATVDELVGRSAHELFPHTVGSAVDQACARVLATGEPEFVDDHHPGWDRWFRNRIQRCRLGVIVEFYDVTEQRRVATQQLHESAVLNQLVSYADAIIAIKDLDGRYLFANEACARNTNSTPGDMVGRTIGDLIGPEIGALTRGYELEVQRTRRPTHVEETHVRGPDDVRTYLSVRFPVYTETGHLAGTGGIHTDISDWKRTQERLARSERRFRDVFAASSLGHLVVDREADLVL
jgi:PAS domain S-box-containing protein